MAQAYLIALSTALNSYGSGNTQNLLNLDNKALQTWNTQLNPQISKNKDNQFILWNSNDDKH